jgi:prevent-host-death family protein
MNKSSTFVAKNNLSALIAAAIKGEPQVITNNGAETAVLISYEEYRKLTAKDDSLVEFLLKSPLKNSDIDLSRSKEEGGREKLDFE